jgi:hypothetical protein
MLDPLPNANSNRAFNKNRPLRYKRPAILPSSCFLFITFISNTLTLQHFNTVSTNKMQIPNFTTAIFGLAALAGLSTTATLRRISYPVMVCKECDPSTDWPLCIQDPMGDCVESGTLTLLHITWAYTNVVPGKSNVSPRGLHWRCAIRQELLEGDDRVSGCRAL